MSKVSARLLEFWKIQLTQAFVDYEGRSVAEVEAAAVRFHRDADGPLSTQVVQ